MQRHCLCVVQPFKEVIGCNKLPRFLARQRTRMRIIESLREHLRVLLSPAAISFLVHTLDLPILQVAIDVVFLDTLSNLRLGRLGKVPQLACPLQAELFENPPKIADGWVTLNDAPGLGLTLSEDAVAKYGERVPI